jgi:hypothetical protein
MQFPWRQIVCSPVQGSMRQAMRGPGHFGSGDVLAKGRHEQMPQPSENVRQSASVLHAVDVPGSALGCDVRGVAAPSTFGNEDAGGTPIAGGLVGAADPAGGGGGSLRTHALANASDSAAHVPIKRDAARKSSADRTRATRVRDRGMAAAYRSAIALASKRSGPHAHPPFGAQIPAVLHRPAGGRGRDLGRRRGRDLGRRRGSRPSWARRVTPPRGLDLWRPNVLRPLHGVEPR